MSEAKEPSTRKKPAAKKATATKKTAETADSNDTPNKRGGKGGVAAVRKTRDGNDKAITPSFTPGSRMFKLLSGEISIEDLDTEELARGQLRNKNGTFQGRPPLLIPRQFHERAMREIVMRGEEVFRKDFVDAVKLMGNIVRDTEAKDETRMKAATYIIDRIMGKPKEQIEFTGEQPWKVLLEGIIVETPADESGVVDAEVVGDSSA